MASQLYSTLIKPAALRTLIDNKVPVRIFDASYNIPGSTGDPKQDHFLRRIPTSKFFEIDEIADKTSNYPHMMPTVETFRTFMQKLQTPNNETLTVVYDRQGMISAPRAWFTFLAFNKKNIAVLDGGLPKWIAEGHPVESGEYSFYSSEQSESLSFYNYSLNKSLIKSIEDVKEISAEILSKGKNSKYQILDARSPGRFQGVDPEPRKGLRSGSIPGSLNFFFKNGFNKDGTMKSAEELRKMFEELGVSFDERVAVVNSCGSGMTACINILALKVAGKSNTLLYDGSWMEWGNVVKA